MADKTDWTDTRRVATVYAVELVKGGVIIRLFRDQQVAQEIVNRRVAKDKEQGKDPSVVLMPYDVYD